MKAFGRFPHPRTSRRTSSSVDVRERGQLSVDKRFVARVELVSKAGLGRDEEGAGADGIENGRNDLIGGKPVQP